ncbi:alpha/beta hydrolase [Desulfobacula sp.]|uniref:alpha/beta hydrolase n=1 Tax=Desulfobacula sp. TaxID=2593537 RepID=UPI00261A9BF1|nr:alpha/beta hydrolase [Desulfobacula sp.]
MNHINGTFKSVRDSNIYYQAWLPEGKIKAVLFLIHGLGEYCGRYTNVVNYFLPLGYAVYGLDHIGHGRSDGEPEVIERFRDYTDTLALYYDMVKGWQPDTPVFIYGHSMGGLISCYYLLDHPGDFKGAILSAPAIKASDKISSVTILMGRILSWIAPRTGVMGMDASGVSRDPKVVEAYVNDDLVFHGKTPARLAVELLKAMGRVTTETHKLMLPFIVVQGDEDKLVDPGGAQMLYDNAGSKDKTLKRYRGWYHEVHNEPERATMFKDVETWLAAHL